MKKIHYIIIIGILIGGIHGLYGNNIEVSNIWTSNTLIGLNGEYGGYYIDVGIFPNICVAVVNRDTYQHNIILDIKSDEGISWQSPIISMPPSPNKGEVINAKLKFEEFGPHKIYVSVLDENGNILTSKTTTIYVANPIDIEYITCSDSYVNESNPNIEVCNSPWFKISLKNNKYSQSDYMVKTWIAVVSQDYNKDASKNKNDAGVLYYGENDSKLIYVPKYGESEVSFKIPPVVQDADAIKIQVHTDVMGVHDYADGPANTEITGSDNLNIIYSRNKSDKKFFYPISLTNFEVVTNINKTTADILRKFYKDSNIEDDELKKMIDHYSYYNKDNVIPRAYLKTDPYLAIVKLTLKNRFDGMTSGTILVENDMGTATENVNMSSFETKDVYIPCYINYTGNKQIKIVICSAGTYTYIETKNLNINPEKIPVVKIKNIIYSYDNKSYVLTNNYADILVGRTYIMKITLVNNYNKTLSGNLILKDDFKEGVVNYISDVPFTLGAHAEKTISIPISFNTGANGDVQFFVKTDDALAEFSKTIHFNAHNIKAELDYNDTLRPKIAVINENPVFRHYPVAGCYNTFVATLNNPLNEKIECLTWIEVVRGDGYVKTTTLKRIVYIPPNGLKTIDFKIKFNEGFEGHILFYAIPTARWDNLSNATPIITKPIKVVAPLSITNLTYNNSQIHAEIVSDSVDAFPVNIHYNYWIELIKDNVSVFKSEAHSEMIHPLEIKHINVKLRDLDEGNYTLKLYVEIPNFIKDNGAYYPMVLEKSKNIVKKGGVVKNNNISMGVIKNNNISITPPSVINNNSVDNHSTSELNNHTIPENINNTAKKSVFESIYSIIRNLISTVFSAA